MARVTLDRIGKRFGHNIALADLSLEIRDREFYVLLGPTGAGKTTALRCIAGLEKPDGGTISIDGEDVGTWSAAERDVAIVFQYYSLYPHFTVRQNLEFPLKSKLRNLPAAEIATRVDRAARTLRIEHLLDRKTDRLSGGEMQRVSIGRAIVRDPRLFLMDEPLSNLDAKLREILRAELKDLQVNLGATFLYVTHDQVEAMTMGDKIGILDAGRLVQSGTPYEIYNRPANTFVASFVGSPAINLLPATLDNGSVRLPIAGGDIVLGNARPTADGPVTLGVRSEDVRLVGPGEGIAAQVYAVENQGVEKVVTLRTGELTIRATVPARFAVNPDTPAWFKVEVEKLHFFDSRSGARLTS